MLTNFFLSRKHGNRTTSVDTAFFFKKKNDVFQFYLAVRGIFISRRVFIYHQLVAWVG